MVGSYNKIDIGHGPHTSKKGKKKSGFRFFQFLSFLLLFCVVAAAFFYFNREENIITIKIASGPFRSDSYELMSEVADVVARNSDKIRVKVVDSRDSSSNITLLNTGKVDLATIRADTPVVKDVRMVANLFPDYFQLIARGNSPIFRPKDLVGKKVALSEFGTDEFRSFWVLADHYDLPIRSIDWHTMKLEKATEALLNNKVDAILMVRSLRDRIVLDLFDDAALKNLHLRFVSINQAEAITIKRPFLDVGRIPQGAFLGQGPIPIQQASTVTVDRVLVSREDVDNDAVRELTRILFEHRFDLTIRFALANAIERPSTEEGLSIPIHEGAEQFYTRNEPSFVQENAEPLALLVTVIAMLISTMIALRSRFVSAQKNTMDTYNYVLLDITDKSVKVNTIEGIRELQLELYEMLGEVVHALDTDDVTEDGFQSFSLLWEAAREILKERKHEMEQQSQTSPISEVQRIAKKPKEKARKKKQKRVRKQRSI